MAGGVTPTDSRRPIVGSDQFQYITGELSIASPSQEVTMKKPLQATPVVRGKDAERVFAPVRTLAPLDTARLEKRAEAFRETMRVITVGRKTVPAR